MFWTLRLKHAKKIYCNDLSSSECSTFRLNIPDQVCLPDGGKCRIKSCSEFTNKEECESIKFTDKGYKCVFSENNGCEFSSCYSNDNGASPTDCEQFIPVDPLYKCIKEKDSGYCRIDPKECEDLPQGQCDLFNTEENLEDFGKCVERNGYCFLDYSSNIEFSISLLFLLFFLFWILINCILKLYKYL